MMGASCKPSRGVILTGNSSVVATGVPSTGAQRSARFSLWPPICAAALPELLPGELPRKGAERKPCSRRSARPAIGSEPKGGHEKRRRSVAAQHPVPLPAASRGRERDAPHFLCTR
jgi:hypothetical protein